MVLPALTAMLQQGDTIASTPWDLIGHATPVTKVILLVLAAFSLFSWVMIFWKWSEFRKMRQSGDTFVAGMESATGLRDVYQTLTRLEESPYTRVFRRGVNFFTELRPTALRDDGADAPGLSSAQLDTLRLVLEKELADLLQLIKSLNSQKMLFSEVLEIYSLQH